MINRRFVVVFMAVGVGLLHFLTGPRYSGPFPVFVNSYMIDILLPFVMYLVLGIAEVTIFRSGIVRGVAVFAVGVLTETLQLFAVPVFGRTFDPLDYLMFGGGVLLGVVFERIVLSRIPAGGRSRTSRDIG